MILNSLFKKKLIRKYQATIYHIDGPSIDVLNPDIAKWTFSEGDYYETNVVFWFKKFLSAPNSVLYDVGANIGYYSALGGKLADRVYSFEPVDSTREILRVNIKLNKLRNVTVFSEAIGDKNGSGRINVYNHSGNNSIYNRNIPKGHEVKFVKKQLVKLSTLDRLVQNCGLKEPTLIKMDIEGAELPALHGAAKLIKKSQPIIICEYGTTTSEDAGYKRTDIVKFLENLDYKVMGLSGEFKDNRLYELDSKKVKQIDNIIALPAGNHEKYL